jgi:hypothetical protein
MSRGSLAAGGKGSVMIRLLAAMALICLVGCASKGEQDEAAGPPEETGRSSSASTWTGSVSTRSPVSDNTAVSSTSPIGAPGIVTNSDAGFCWITAISGSFRGSNEYAGIFPNGSGYFRAEVRSNTSYDGVTGVGPAMSMKCRNLTDFTALGNVGAFSHSGFSVSGSGGSPNYGQATSSANSGSMYPWGGVNGRLGDACAATWMISAMDHGSDTAFSRWAYACPLPFQANCNMTAYTNEIRSNTYTWTYSVTGASASNTADVQLVSNSPAQECYVDGVWGWWTATSSAKVEVQADGYWHLVTNKGSAALGMGAYAACFPLAQGF